MDDRVAQIYNKTETFKVTDLASLEEFRKFFISRKGEVAILFDELAKMPVEKRKKYGIVLNKLKNDVEAKFSFLSQKVSYYNKTDCCTIARDLTLPPPSNTLGSLHPICTIVNKIGGFFNHLGFCIVDGPEIENDWYNFGALNFHKDHPARDMQDTFYVCNGLLRTHTTNVQIRIIESQKPPTRAISYGKVFRNEAISARSHCFFHQIEGVYINEEVSLVDLKTILLHFVRYLFGSKVEIRFRPSYFPFTEPSIEVDISCTICNENGCKICKYSGWVELGGAGMIDSQVFINCDVDCEKYSGFAFGIGIERIAMLLYHIDDLRIFTENDVRFLNQFTVNF